MSQISLEEFAHKLHEVMPTIMRQFAKRQQNELYTGKITLPQFLVLDYLDSQGASRMTDLAHFMEVTTAATTGIIERLVKSGYVRRIFDTGDRRIIKIELTAKGEGLTKKINQQRHRMIMKTFSKISGKERQDYMRMFSRLHDILVQEKEGSIDEK